MIPSITSMKNAFDLSGKKALVTGGNRGLGLGIAAAMAQSGADIAIFCRDSVKAGEAIAELEPNGGRYESFSCDIADIKSVRRAVNEGYESFGNFDILVNNAGISCFSELLNMDEDLTDWYNVEEMSYIINQMPARRFGEPIEVGAMAVYLASPASAQVTGTVMVIDGGYMLSC